MAAATAPQATRTVGAHCHLRASAAVQHREPVQMRVMLRRERLMGVVSIKVMAVKDPGPPDRNAFVAMRPRDACRTRRCTLTATALLSGEQRWPALHAKERKCDLCNTTCA